MCYNFWLISIARYVLSLQVFAFEGQNMMFTQLRTCYLHSILWRRSRLLLQLFASTVGRFLSRISYLPSYIFLRRCRSFTSRKLYACLRNSYVSCSYLIELVSGARWTGLFLLWSFCYHRIQVCWLRCVLYHCLAQAVTIHNTWQITEVSN